MKQIFLLATILVSAFCISAQTKEAQKVDGFILDNCETAMARLDNYAIYLHNEPQTTAYIIFYEGKIPKYPSKKVSPRRGEAKTKVDDLKRYLIENRGISLNRVTIVSGGLREEFSVEFWLIHKGAILPKPSPTRKKIKYAKGRPSRLCSEMF